MSEFMPDVDIFTLSIPDEEKFLVNAPAKSLSSYTHDLAPVTPTFIPVLCFAT